MKVALVGLGIQGQKRKAVASSDLVATVDPYQPDAQYRSIEDVPLNDYDAAILCIPDEPKISTIEYLLNNGKHLLVEKPLFAGNPPDLFRLKELAQNKRVVCYTAYNHRFEPHFIKMRDLIASGELGKIYSCRMFYGNGTARLVRESNWRDQGDGVLPDLGSHLLDTCRFWFGNNLDSFSLASYNRFENQAPDHVVVQSEKSFPRINLEMTLCMWKNHFTCDILAERGTAHIESLCKWGPSIFTHRKRVLPSGKPDEYIETLIQSDPTWEAEYKYFKELINKETPTNLTTDLWLQKNLRLMGLNIIK